MGKGVTAVRSNDHHTILRGMRWSYPVEQGMLRRLRTPKFQAWLDQARRPAGRNLSKEEWEQYFPGEPYRKTFPKLPPGR
jgi:hypothetical protein